MERVLPSGRVGKFARPIRIAHLIRAGLTLHTT